MNVTETSPGGPLDKSRVNSDTEIVRAVLTSDGDGSSVSKIQGGKNLLFTPTRPF